MDGYSRGTKLSSSLEIKSSNISNDEERRKDVLKIKHFFVKPKYLKNGLCYLKNPINSSYYGTIKIKNYE